MDTQKVLGLDLGVGSIGWALIEVADEKPVAVLGMGSRIVPIDSTDCDKFTKGQAITINAERTQRRTIRKGYNRYQQRRELLTRILRQHGMMPVRTDENQIDLWKLRSDAATPGCQLSLPEIGRVLYHINQKRGYKHSKADMSNDKKQTEYVEAVNNRYKELIEKKLTVGQFLYGELLGSAVQRPAGPYYTFRIKDKVYPREAYIAEFDQIMQVQKVFYPDILTDELIDTLRNRVIFYQRPLKSCKHLVSICEFEKRPYKRPDGVVVYDGPKCAPRTSPLAQLCALWETVNNIVLEHDGETYPFTQEERQKMVQFLCEHEKMTKKDLLKVLGLSAKAGYYGSKTLDKGIKGNSTLLQLRKALGKKYAHLLKMDLQYADYGVDTETGEVIQIIKDTIEQEPLYRLWHVVYSVSNRDELRKALANQFGIDDEEVVENLYKTDFVKPGYANKSHKFMRKLLPYLMQGEQYSAACAAIGINHSNSLTGIERNMRPLADKIPLLQKNELRQPIIEKILNQMINIVNALKAEYGEIDEVRIELARELKQSKDEREKTDKRNKENEKKNAEIAKKIEEHGVRPTRSRIQKYKMWEESNSQCFYCGKNLTITAFLNGIEAEVEHIIPQSLLFDDSFSNKVCACRACNQAKGNKTAMEFIETKQDAEQEAYKKRVAEAYDANRISKTKRDHLLWHTKDIPLDFIDRQLRQSQYISRKAMEILQQGVRKVTATSGSVTDFLRHQWGYDEILHTLNLPVYRQVEELITEDGRIKNWTKRLDHRHHAIDALVIAQTKQGYIQRLNSLNASRETIQEEMSGLQSEVLKGRENEKKSLLERYICAQPHIPVSDATRKVDGILVSFRAGKKVTTPAKRAIYRHGKRIVVQTGLQVPRGALAEETIYGKRGERYVVKYALDHQSIKPQDIIDPTIRRMVEGRLAEFGGKAKNAFAEPLHSAEGMKIRSVRCYTGLKEQAVVPVRTDTNGNPIGYAKLGNNHHIALYKDKDGKYQEQVVSFWRAVERKYYGIPIVIEKPKEVWNNIIESAKELPQEFLDSLPGDDWEFVLSLQQNEMFILGMDDAEFEDAIEKHDYRALNKHLYRVQKIATKNYCFRYHTETKVDDKYEGTRNEMFSKRMAKIKLVQSFDALWAQHPHKVKVNLLGEISVV